MARVAYSKNTSAIEGDVSQIEATVDALQVTVGGKANDNAVVHKTGDEAIAGVKNFEDARKNGVSVATTDTTTALAQGLANEVARAQQAELALTTAVDSKETPAAAQQKADAAQAAAIAEIQPAIDATVPDLVTSEVAGRIQSMELRDPNGSLQYVQRTLSNGQVVLDQLKYPRPDTTGFNELILLTETTYSLNGGSAVSFTSSIDLDDTKDYVLRNPNKVEISRDGGIHINGGRKVLTIGWQIRISDVELPGPYGPGNQMYHNQSRIAFEWKDQVELCWIEGCRSYGNRLGDGFVLNCAGAEIVMQNNLDGGYDPVGLGSATDNIDSQQGNGDYDPVEVHADCIQIIKRETSKDLLWRESTLKIYNFLGRTAYQGYTTNNRMKRIEIEKIHIDMLSQYNWDGSRIAGYAWGQYNSQGGFDITEYDVGPDLVNATDRSLGAVFSSQAVPELEAGFVKTTNPADPAWKRPGYGVDYSESATTIPLSASAKQIAELELVTSAS